MRVSVKAHYGTRRQHDYMLDPAHSVAVHSYQAVTSREGRWGARATVEYVWSPETD